MNEANGAEADKVQDAFRADIQHLQVMQQHEPSLAAPGSCNSSEIRAALLCHEDWESPMELVCIDKNKCSVDVLVVTDHFTKMVHAFPCRNQTTKQIAKPSATCCEPFHLAPRTSGHSRFTHWICLHICRQRLKTHIYKISDVLGHCKVVHRNLLLEVNYLPVQDVQENQSLDISSGADELVSQDSDNTDARWDGVEWLNEGFWNVLIYVIYFDIIYKIQKYYFKNKIAWRKTTVLFQVVE